MSAHTFSRAGTFKYGYNRKQVDAFFDRAKHAYKDSAESNVTEDDVRQAAFSWVRNGYKASEVDGALDRLERALLQRRRANVMVDTGESAWLDYAYGQAESLYPRMLRKDGERFANAKDYGYAKSEVDAFISQIARYFEGQTQLTSKEVRDVVFRRARKGNAYDEAVVDVYLDRVISVLIAVE
ncbi:DivIVA domain-containing protein [Arcanobacterium hippocoleae]|uniref:DivIVA domain-containing protein n=1 Tax=Arcanobacterium hippocoleae TaxID=149017 RepID=A0ABU1T138_9ACTO|nr:DivIVA domain-containing protein [Arcanobacterium hippocoleae]MDR6939081.1 DivIVA domain-containing protein [Arcanobacterium hippocoleae]